MESFTQSDIEATRRYLRVKASEKKILIFLFAVMSICFIAGMALIGFGTVDETPKPIHLTLLRIISYVACLEVLTAWVFAYSFFKTIIKK